MNKLNKLFCFFGAALILSSCAPAAVGPGQIESIAPKTTLWVIQRAVSLSWGTIRLQSPDGNMVFLAAYMKDAGTWGYVFLNAAEKNVFDWLALVCGGTGNCCSKCTMADVVTGLLNKQWGTITAMPATITAALSSSKSWLTSLANVPVLVLPAGILDVPEGILPEPAGIVE